MTMAFVRDPQHWLYRFDSAEWIRAGLAELRRAEGAYKQRNAAAGLACAKRAAGMALNAALVARPNEAWGRSYVDHLMALADDPSAPAVVREGCGVLLRTHAPGVDIITLRSPRTDERVLEAARDVMAHAYFLANRE